MRCRCPKPHVEQAALAGHSARGPHSKLNGQTALATCDRLELQPTIICDRVALAQDAALEDIDVAVLVRLHTAAVECAAALDAAATQREVCVVADNRTATAAKVGSRTVRDRAVHKHGARPLPHAEPAAAFWE